MEIKNFCKGYNADKIDGLAVKTRNEILDITKSKA